MLKRRASLLRFLCILGQAGELGELGELLTDQSNRHKVIFIEHVSAIFSNVLHFAQQRKSHALSATRYALGIIHIQNLYQLSRNLHK